MCYPFPAVEDFPATGEEGRLYLAEDTGAAYRCDGNGGYVPIRGADAVTIDEMEDHLVVPDYANAETINRVDPVLGGSWVADRSGFVRVGGVLATADAGNVVNVFIDGQSALWYNGDGGSGDTGMQSVCPITKGSTVTIRATPDGTPLKAAYCFYIPPKFVTEKPVIVSDEQFRNYFAVPDFNNTDSSIKIPDINTNYVISKTGFYRFYITAITTGPSRASVSRKNLLSGSHTEEAETFGTAGSYTFIKTIAVTAGDTISLDWTNATLTANSCFFVYPKFVSVSAPTVEEWPFVPLTQDYFNLYVDPAGSDSNEGTSAGLPLATIPAAFQKASKVVLPTRGGIRINLAAGEYTLPDNYTLPLLNPYLFIAGANIDTTIINVNGVGGNGILANYVNSRMWSFTLKGACDTAGNNALLQTNGGTAEFYRVAFLGTNKTVAYNGLFAGVGTARLVDCRFNNLPVCVNTGGAFVVCRDVMSASSGNDLMYKTYGGIIDSHTVPVASYTRYKEEAGGGLVIGFNAQIPANTDLNTVGMPGVYYFSYADAGTITNKPDTTKTCILKVERSTSGAYGVNQHLAETSTSAVSTGSEWYRQGYGPLTGTITWGPWKRFITDADVSRYDHTRMRYIYADSAVKTWVRLASITTPTVSGGVQSYGITFDARANNNQAVHAIGQLSVLIRNNGTSILVDTKLIKVGHADIEFGLTSIPSPGGIIDLFFCTTSYPSLVYENTGHITITVEGTISSPITTQPSGYTKIVPTALATA
jgi:hypothetical protein